ncbi:hypothetical protein RMATCC62417_05513 [Rhizopus microsporus]|nr:hypothetical protein RMATCC62417_05513 [Rhizopus microsporus]
MDNTMPTIIGASWSSYTRTICMALIHLGVPFKLQHAYPHSKLAYAHHPFGRIPTLIHGTHHVFETMAIREYIDTVFSSKLTPKDLETRIKMAQWISALNDYVFHYVVEDVCRRRLLSEAAGKSQDEITKLLVRPIKRAKPIMAELEVMTPDDGDYLCGQQLTWADLFVYPALAVIFALPEASIFIEIAPKLSMWARKFEKRKEAIETFKGTIADDRNAMAKL